MLLTLFLPLVNFLVISSCGRFLGRSGTVYLSLSNMLVSICINLYLIVHILQTNNFFILNLGTWIRVFDIIVS